MEKVPKVTSNEEKMTIELSSKLVQEAEALLLKTAGVLEGPVSIPASEGEISAMLSATKEDLIALKVIEFQGKNYYLGIPRK